MADHIYTVRVRKTAGKPEREFYDIRANSKDGAIDRAVDIFHVNKSDCTAIEER